MYCLEWGLTINISKTAILVFNRSGRLLKESHNFILDVRAVTSAKSYCYLGVTFSLTGSFKATQNILRQKGLRAYFSLKKSIDLYAINKEAVTRLFDSLVLPVVSYSCQVWLTSTNTLSLLASSTKSPGLQLLTKIASDPLEKLHLSILKWTLGVGKRTSNAAVWGDTGRYPLAITLTKQLIDYYGRLKHMDDMNSPQLARHAFVEQRNLKLAWYTTTSSVISMGSTISRPIQTSKAPSGYNKNISTGLLKSGTRKDALIES